MKPLAAGRLLVVPAAPTGAEVANLYRQVEPGWHRQGTVTWEWIEPLAGRR